MAYKSGVTNTIYDFMEIINTFLTTELGDDNWVTDRIVRNVDNKITEAIWHGKGESLNDKIYIGMKPVITSTTTGRIVFNGYCGFDSALGFYDNVGCINEHTDDSGSPSLPTLPLVNNTSFSYYLMANASRVIIVVKLSTLYESAYLGLTAPISVERQYPYPLLIAGSGKGSEEWNGSNGNPSIVNPQGLITNSTMRLRLPDGTWKGVTSGVNDKIRLFPYNCNQTSLLPIYKTGGVISADDHMLFPVLIYQKSVTAGDAVGIMCQLDGVHFVSATKDLEAEQVLILANKQYKCFDTMRLRTPNSYFVVSLDD